jgi:hypothetical protein
VEEISAINQRLNGEEAAPSAEPEWSLMDRLNELRALQGHTQ